MNAHEAAANTNLGTASARKTGRNARWPYVPVIVHAHGNLTRDEQLLGRAYATRLEAVEYAVRTIDDRRASLARQLAEPRMRALREQYGLPRELTD